jgi:hypothetical protein
MTQTVDAAVNITSRMVDKVLFMSASTNIIKSPGR